MTEYRRIGDYISLVDDRNTAVSITNLVGLTIAKKFIPSVANINGTDLSNYKIIRKGQFACSLMQVSRDGKFPVAMYAMDEPAIMSPAYPMFEVTKLSEILPEYMMLWFSRSEFDREACFYAVGGVRGSLDWEDFCNMKIPVPDIDIQRRIVAEYQAVEKRIATNERLIAKLDDKAQTIYKKTFVDNVDLTHLPGGWRIGTLRDIADCFDSKRKPMAGDVRANMARNFPYYGAAALMDYVEDYIFDGEFVLMGEDGSVCNEDGSPVLQLVRGKMWVNNHAHVLQGKNGFSNSLLYLKLSSTNVTDIITGGVQGKINQENMFSISVIIPDTETLSLVNSQVELIYSQWFLRNEENNILGKLKDALLSKMS